MKAVRMHAYGGLEVLQFEDAPRPQPNDDQILIRIIAAGVNPVDAKIRQGMFARMMGTKLPLIPGLDVSGIVEEAGANVTKFKPGDAVYACLGFGTQGGYAEYAVAKESEASPKPKGLNHEGAAAMPVAAATAWQALIEIANVSQGQTVLIHGGSGGVGVFAIQIAKARGAKVIATASAANQEFMRELGADRAIDYNATKFEEVVKDVDVVLDSVAGETLQRSYGVVKKGGIIVSLLEPPDKAELDARGIRGTAFMVSPNASLLSDLSKLVEAKKLKPVVSKTFPLAEAAKAQEAIETGHTRGKIVLRVADEPKG
ncbi:MAG: NADP-dependent oxidoreductase [Chthoniobacterales bacterium]|nr:NADP-dependent oxidoreductase [Chthoniobacterales bacterium]